MLNPSLPKSLTASVVSTTATTTTVRIFVQGPPLNNDPIPDGPLYTCTFDILPGTSPGSYALTNGNLIAEDPNAAPLAYVAGADGAVNVVLVLPTATPTPLGAKIQLSNNIGLAGGTVGITADINTAGNLIAGTGNESPTTTTP